MNENDRPPLPEPGTFGACYDCGRHYGDEFGFPDLVLPHDVWAKISPRGDEGGLLCPSCICRRAHALGMTGVPAMWASGPLKSEPYTPATPAPEPERKALMEQVAQIVMDGSICNPHWARDVAERIDDLYALPSGERQERLTFRIAAYLEDHAGMNPERANAHAEGIVLNLDPWAAAPQEGAA
jgi:hypothetical protein